MKLDLPYLMRDVDRHGNTRLFVRRNGRKIRIKEFPARQPSLKPTLTHWKRSTHRSGARPRNRTSGHPRLDGGPLF